LGLGERHRYDTESGKEVREFHGIIVPARTAEISPRYKDCSPESTSYPANL